MKGGIVRPRGILLCFGMATPKKTAPTKSATAPKAEAAKPASKPAAAKPAAKSAAEKPAAAAAPAKKPTQLDLMLAAQAKKRAEAKDKGKAAPSAKGLGLTGNGVHGHMNTNAKGGAVGVARRTAPGA